MPDLLAQDEQSRVRVATEVLKVLKQPAGAGLPVHGGGLASDHESAQILHRALRQLLGYEVARGYDMPRNLAGTLRLP